MNHCLRHYEEPIAAHCRTCSHPFCTRCLVFAFGPKKPPYCVGCALHASGVRNGTPRVTPPASEPDLVEDGPDKRAERALRRAERSAAKVAAREQKRAQKVAATESGSPNPPVPLVNPPAAPAHPMWANTNTGIGQP